MFGKLEWIKKMSFDLTRVDHKKYVAGSLVIGVAQIIDSCVVLYGIKNNLTTAFSLLELCWFLMSLFFVAVLRSKQLPVTLPIIYICYYIFGWFYGSYLIASMPHEQTLLLPTWYMVFAGMFGFFFFLASLYYTRLWRCFTHDK